jgi:hypothetical protein
MVRERHQLRADPGPAEQPVVVVDVVDRLDVHAIWNANASRPT